MGFIAQALGLDRRDDGASAAQQRQMEIQQKQEERLAAQEGEQGRALAASIRARTRGGYRQLLSPERIAPETGLPVKLSGL